MYITNGLPATLIKYNRGLETNTGVWDDEYTKEPVKSGYGYFVILRIKQNEKQWCES